MNALLQTGEIKLLEKGDLNDPIYLLCGNGRFYNTEYKIMSNTPELIKCYKGTLNGQTELVFLTEDLIPLSAILPQLHEDAFLTAAAKICDAVGSIAENGFLNWQHLDLDKERIFIHPADQSVHLVNLPVEGVYLAPGFMDMDIRQLIVDLSTQIRNPESQKMTVLRNHVQLREESLHEFVSYLDDLAKAKLSAASEKSNERLALINEEQKHTIVIDKPQFLIGKKSTAVDGVISYSRFVGRVHCRIVYKDGEYFVYDMNSMNGTFVNDIAVETEKGMRLQDGDIFKIANVKFRVSCGEI